MKYNPSIDGLRTFAVLPVFIFHLNENWLTGGYLGVDIFFTISGFLITTILLREFSSGSFSYFDFYKRRIKRILPAYFFLLAVISVAAAAIMLPYEFYKFSISAASSIFFLSNINYALRTGDYFSADASQWPLLHLWSLSVEEQFYVFWPIILSFVFASAAPLKTVRNRVFYFVTFLIVASLVIATFLSVKPGLAKWNYYLVITRASELLIGALLAVLIAKGAFSGFSQKWTIPAFVILISCFVLYDKTVPFPGYWVLPPCLAVMVVLGGRQEGYLYQFLSYKPLVSIGLISYSLYLWHWPVIAFTRYVFDMGGDSAFEISVLQAGFIIIAAFLMALISYRYVETPLRSKDWTFGKSFWRIFAIPAGIGGIFFVGSIVSNGYPDRLKSENIEPIQAYFSINKERCPHLLNLGCRGGDINSETRYLLVGNSHAEHYFEFFHVLGSHLGVSVDLSAGGGCAINRKSVKCKSIYKYATDNAEKYDGFILAERWNDKSFDESSETRKGYDEFISSLKAEGKPILMVGRMPEYSVDIDKVINYQRIFSALPPNVNLEPGAAVHDINKHVEQYTKTSEIQFVNVYQHLGSSGYKFDVIDLAGSPLYLDNHHFSVYGSASMARYLLSYGVETDLMNSYFGLSRVNPSDDTAGIYYAEEAKSSL